MCDFSVRRGGRLFPFFFELFGSKIKEVIQVYIGISIRSDSEKKKERKIDGDFL